MRQPCTNCTLSPAYAKGLCRICYKYEHRCGQPRPLRVIQRQCEREMFEELPIDKRIDMARLRALPYQRGAGATTERTAAR